jgi:hypothetical protein
LGRQREGAARKETRSASNQVENKNENDRVMSIV